MLDGWSTDDCILVFDAVSGWHAICPSHPISANATHIERITVVAADGTSRRQIDVISTDASEMTSIGKLYSGEIIEFPYSEGSAEVVTNEETYTSTVYTRRSCVTADQLGIARGAEELLLISGDGEKLTVTADAFFQLSGNRLDFIDAETRREFTDVRVIYADPPR